MVCLNSCVIKPFSTNLLLPDKPGSWFLPAKCLKNNCARVTLYNVTLPQVFFKHFANKNQLPGFYISETLVENGLNKGIKISIMLRIDIRCFQNDSNY